MNMDIKKVSKNYNVPKNFIEERESGRKLFIEKFPINTIENLTIDEYVAGTDKNSFCYWLEFKKIGFGIGGGNASKFGLYKSKDGIYFTGSRSNKKELNGEKLNLFFSKLKNDILKALDYAEKNEIDKIKEIDSPIWNMVIQKILSIYYPNKFLQIGSADVLVESAKSIQLKEINLEIKNSIQINYEIFKTLKSQSPFKDWNNEKLSKFIWDTFNEKIKTDYFIIGSKYGASNGKDVFPIFLEKSVIATGFAWNIDLTDLYLKKQLEITNYLKEKEEDSNSYNTLKHFLNLKVGDKVAVKADGSPKGKKGFLSIIGIAEVVEVNGKIYKYDPNGLGHTINVEFSKAPVYREFELGGYGRTIHKLSNQEHIELIFDSEYEAKELPTSSIRVSNPDRAISSKTHHPLNTIFYGPPGTGKTYNTIKRAAEIIEGRTIDDYNEALKIYKEKLHSQIEFITFHQNYSYEDFIQGLRPDVESGNLAFEQKDGIFKKLADKGLENLKESLEKPEAISKKGKFTQALELLKDKVIESDENIMINNTAYFTAVEDNAFRYSADNWTLNDKGFSGFRMKYSDLIRFYEEDVKQRKDIKSIDNISGLAKQHASYFFKAYEIIKALIQEEVETVKIVELKNYVIIIDEINRANISRVFGELITLIEPDKRFGNKLGMEILLPSGDKFTIPNNLYIIGTMNTADKSIALLDIALRRRFNFEAMFPQYEIEGHTIYNKEVLHKINKEIIEEKGHDFQIGHSYFMGEENRDLKKVMNNKVIPLLLEYFMNDTKTVIEILQNAGLEVDKNVYPLRINN